MVRQHPPHLYGRHREEVRPVAPVDLRPFEDPQVCLVHQGGGLQRVIRPLTGHPPARHRPQVGIHRIHQFVSEVPLAAPNVVQHAGNIVGFC